MRLILVRHGKPAEAGDAPTGNPPLSEPGHDQARRVARFLEHEPIELIVHSGMQRAAQTAEPLIARLGLDPRIVPDLGEVDRYGGAYANIEMVKAKGGSEWSRFLADPIGYFGVDADRFRNETLAAFESLFNAGRRKTVAVFTHGFPINILLSHALALENVAHFVPDYGSITRVTGSALDRLTVVSVNETGHQRLSRMSGERE